MTDPLRQRVADAARATGYSAADLEQIAVAVWPDYTPGDLLDGQRLQAIADTVLPLCRDSLPAGAAGDLVAAYRAEHGDQWRTRFWQVRQGIAERRRARTPRQDGGVSTAA